MKASGGRPLLNGWWRVYGVRVGYILIIIAAIVLIPLVYVVFARRPGADQQGQKPIGKPVMVQEPAADEATPAASSIRKDTSEAQRRTPAS